MRNRFTVPFGEWPESARAAWAQSGETYIKKRQAYGRFLSWVRENGLPLATLPTADLMDLFVGALQAAHSQKAALSYLELLFYAMRVVAPERNWGWLRHRFLELRPRRQSAPGRHNRRQRIVSLAFEAWPAHHQARWRAAALSNERDEEFTEQGPTAHLRETTRELVAERYGQWLSAARSAGRPHHVTADAVRHYIRKMQDQNLAVSTIAISVDRLHRAMRILEPALDWRWLRRTAKNLKSRARRVPKRKYGKIVDPAEISLLGRELIERADRLRPDDHEAAVLFRDGLLLCVLACSPVRVRTIALTEVGVHLVLGNSEAWLRYGPEDVKEGRSDERLLPEGLRKLVADYLRVYRPRLLRDPECKALWISDQGGALTAKRISETVGDRTEAAFGRRITPHRVRDCVATLIRERHPEDSEIAMLVLHHTSRDTTREYQEQVRKIVAQRRAVEALGTHEAELRRRLRQRNDPAARASQPIDRILNDIRRRQTEGRYP